MASPKAKALRELTVEELNVRLRDLKQESLNLRLQRVTGQLENTARVRQVRRESAQVLTVIADKKNA